MLVAASFLAASLLTACLWNFNSVSEQEFEYLPLDDSEYPYANLPRLVIQTENATSIRNKETPVEAKLQIYGKNSPESRIYDLTIRGHGNSSWSFSKYSYRLKFENAVPLFDMPKDKDWILISNHRDKSLVRNRISFQLAKSLGDEYSPRSQFVEVFVNKDYRGIYLLTENIKVAKHRVNIPDNENGFLLEKTSDDDESKSHPAFFSDAGHHFFIRHPSPISDSAFRLVKNQIHSFEFFWQNENPKTLESISHWIDLEDLIRYYLIQEFSKNQDGYFHKSIFIVWKKGFPLQMGPVWDFDLAYGIGLKHQISPENWPTGNNGWFSLLFQNPEILQKVQEYWQNHHSAFEAVIDSVDSTVKYLTPAAKNEYKRWPILGEKFWIFVESFKRYEDTADSLKDWIRERIAWLDAELLSPPSESAAYQ